MNRIPFEPNWAVHPGEILEEHLEARGLTQAEFARRTGLTTKIISTIISGSNPVTPATALAFENVLGMKAAVWTNLQSQWELFEERRRRAPSEAKAKSFLSRFPVSTLISDGVLPRTNDVNARLGALFDFFGVASIEAYDVTVARLAVNHREARGPNEAHDYVFTWLKLGERRARSMNLPRFDAVKFEKAVRAARTMTKKGPDAFWPAMTMYCREAGVALLLLEPFTGMTVYGSTYWIESGNAVIQLSLRRKSNDQFWFTFFHECGHVLLHPKRNFVDGGDGAQSETAEMEANAFAEQVIYGENGVKELREASPMTAEGVKRVADKLGIHPGIVVGTLQHYKDLHFSRLNDLKATFAFVKSE
jgi:HTH-type transcriptional regulator/antitoxin HigA